MRKKLKHITLKCFLLLLALQMLNQSFDSIDFQPFSSNSIGTFNQINTAGEYIAEIFLGNENCYPETQNKSSHKLSSHKHITIAQFEPKAYILTAEGFPEMLLHLCKSTKDYSFLFSENITPPPPKA